MSRRWVPTTVILAVIALGASGCAPSGSGDDSGKPLTAEVVFAAVESIGPGACADDAADMFDAPGSTSTTPQCVRIDPEMRFSTSGGRAALVAASEDADPTPKLIELRLESEDAAQLGDLTGKLVGRAAPQNQMAIIVDGEVRSMPAVMSELSDEVVNISGDRLQELYDRLTG
ncbi:hypothetical protein [Leucobacter sp. wl10]|uniref:SecDF P1 head subdomain-containing protein n=1 Tax=Leucobacter sp. wl10 TaxID=2304677 RepID=UPI0013C2E51E|nr:hypothetical protein [Leucobacter sp. wl10]